MIKRAWKIFSHFTIALIAYCQIFLKKSLISLKVLILVKIFHLKIFEIPPHPSSPFWCISS